MSRRILLAIAAFLFLCRCASMPIPTPTEARPAMYCSLSCPGGWMNLNAKLCRGSLWMRDIRVTGEYVSRGIDGTVLVDVWIANEGDFDKKSVVRTDCNSFRRQRVQSRDASERGRHPGEPQPWDLPTTP